MTPHKVSKDGSFRFDRVFAGVGRIARASGTKDKKEFAARDRLLTRLYESGQLDTLAAFRDRKLTIAQLVQASRNGQLQSDTLLKQIALQQPLWPAVDVTLPKMGNKEATRSRYYVSLKALRQRSGLGTAATVADLARIDWRALRDRWDRSGADWNHLRRAISSFLSVLLGDSQHPFRRSLLAAFPLEEERARTTSLTAAEFWALVDAAPEHARPCYVVLAITGMRVGEYLRCTPADLHAEEFSIDVPGTKTRASAETIFPASEFWPWIAAGIPSPLAYRWLRNYFKAAATAIGRPELRVHDLRRLFAQLASDAGAPTAQVQAALRHANPAMTRRYEMKVAKREVGQLVGKALGRQRAG